MIVRNSIVRFMAVVLTFFPFSSWAAYQFSEYSFARNPLRVDNQMRIEMTGRSSLLNYRFLSRVGGVNFEQIIDLSSYDFDLDYDASRPDGQRGTVEIDGETYVLPLYDWELRPIVRYADSEYTAVVSIFGEGPDMMNYRYIDYHPALEDTHLGARLMQADILLMDPITFSEAPTEDGRKVYMAGEDAEQTEEQRFLAAIEIMGLIAPHEYQAWVLTDVDLNPQVQLSNGQLLIDMNPYYFFWDSDARDGEELIERYNALVTEYERTFSVYENAYDRYLRAPVNSESERAALQQVQILERRVEAAERELGVLASLIDAYEPAIIEVAELTNSVRDRSELLHSIAPFVFNAVNKTASYAAFFRGARMADAEDWEAFREEIVSEIDLPLVETPNQFSRWPDSVRPNSGRNK